MYAYVNAGGTHGWVHLDHLKLRDAYLWPESG
jgi:hypothetical protein